MALLAQAGTTAQVMANMIKIPANVKNKKKYLIKKADKLWFYACLKKWGRSCLVCGGQATQVHHWIKKSQSLNTRWNIDNGVPVCQTCHYVLEHSPDIKKRRSYEDKIIKSRGQAWWDKLEKEKKKLFKRTIRNILEVIKKLEASQ